MLLVLTGNDAVGSQATRDYNIDLHFKVYPLRFSFVARNPLWFPPGKSANILRGAFGIIFRHMACTSSCVDARNCDLRASCPYALMFEPTAQDAQPSGLADSPRPFVFRALHLDGTTVRIGECFSFDVNLFEMHNPAIAYLVLAFAQLAREGIGPTRGRASLTSVSLLDENDQISSEIFDGNAFLREPINPLRISLQPGSERFERIEVRFVTPTELKSAHQISERPDFKILASRIRDRLSTLRSLYDEGPLDLDFRAFGDRAAGVRLMRCELQQVDFMRQSTRTNQVHSIGGFVGQADYAGELTEFIPYLRAAKWTGVGRQTVWGKGQIEVVAQIQVAQATF
jgi:hypothetical protein